MSGLREHVARAIELDQEEGGAGILTAEEVQALQDAIGAVFQAGFPEHRDVLAGLLHELGPARMHISGTPSRVDAYWLRCADVAIGAYDAWLDQQQARRGGAR